MTEMKFAIYNEWFSFCSELNRSDSLFPNTIFDNMCGNNGDGASRQLKTMNYNSRVPSRSKDDCEVLCDPWTKTEAFESGPMINESLVDCFETNFW